MPHTSGIVKGRFFSYCYVCKRDTPQKVTEQGAYCLVHKGLVRPPKQGAS